MFERRVGRTSIVKQNTHKAALIEQFEKGGSESFEGSNFLYTPDAKAGKVKQVYFTKTAREWLSQMPMFGVLCGPVGCGKTYAICKGLLAYSCKVPAINGVRKVRGVAIRNTADNLRDSTLVSWIEAWPENLPGEWRSSERAWMSVFDHTDSKGEKTRVELEVLFRPMETDKDQRKVLGLNLTWGYVNEIREIRTDNVLGILPRTGRYPGQLPPEERRMMLVGDTNSFDTKHPLYELLFQQKGGDRLAQIFTDNYGMPVSKDQIIKCYRYPGGRSPHAEGKEFMPRGYYEALAEVRGEQWTRIYIDNEFGHFSTGLRCYADFVRDVHVGDVQPIKGFPMQLGIDFGRDMAVVVLQMDDSQVQVVDTWHCEDMSLSAAAPEMAAYLAAKYPPREGWLWRTGGHDPAGEQREQGSDVRLQMIVNNALRKNGLKDATTRSAKSNNPRVRIEAVNDLMTRREKGRERFIIGRHCSHLIEAMDNYIYARKQVYTADGQHRYSDRPDKSHFSHIAEALQYGIMSLRPATRNFRAAWQPVQQQPKVQDRMRVEGGFRSPHDLG